MQVIGKREQRSTLNYPFDLSGTSTWGNTSNLPEARFDAALCYDSLNARLIIGGGRTDATYTALATTKVSYDGVTWAAGPSCAGLYGHKMVQFGNDLWVTGGHTSGGDVRNNIAISVGGTASFTDNLGGSGMTVARGYHGSVVFNGKLYVIGGEGSGGSYLNSISYNSSYPAAFTTVTPAAMWAGRKGLGCIVFQGKVWVIGGQTGSSAYDNQIWWSSSPETSWTQVTPVVTGGSLFGGRSGMSLFIYNGKMYLFGGFNGTTYLSDLYSTVDGTNWVVESVSVTGLAGAGYASALTAFSNQIFYMGGITGTNASPTYTGAVWTYPQDQQATYGNLHVVGTMHAKKLWSYAIGAYYADLGEYFYCDENLPNGTPVSIIGYRKVGRYNGKNFAGIITINSGVYMGEDLKGLPNTALVGLAGTVSMCVDDPSIETGDEITAVGFEFVKKTKETQPVLAIAQTSYNKGSVIVLKT